MNHTHGFYDPLTVFIAFAVATAASYFALTLAGRLFQGTTLRRWRLLAASVVMGAGIWSMHVIGMLAARLSEQIKFTPALAGLSFAITVAACFGSFIIYTGGKQSLIRLCSASLLLSLGIADMHFAGIAVMQSPLKAHYNFILLGLFAFIVFVAICSALLLFQRFHEHRAYRRWKLLSAVLIGLATSGMHYASMAAVPLQSLVPVHAAHADTGEHSSVLLLAGVIGGAFLLIGISWTSLLYDKKVLEKMAYSDALTGLPNRHRLSQQYNDFSMFYEEGFMLYIDFDRFKMINDTMGHDTGDRFIQQMAARLQEALDKNQTLFRFGGDEFLIISSGSRQDAEQLADRLILHLKKPFLLLDSEFYMTASIGISLTPQHGTNRLALLRAADIAMYHAKIAGKNRYCIYDEETNLHTLRKLELEKGLRKALQLQEFDIHYQPKWDAEAGRVIGLEALLRWRHGMLGPISPAEFIPITEETGMIVGITRWVLRKACEQNRYWQLSGLPKLRISVNMSIRVFESGKLEEMVREALHSSGLDPEDLELEITESIAMQDIEETIKQLNAVKAIGVKISMDDFGTGYSSLGTIDRIPIDTLKIDQTFIRQSALPSKQAIISTIIAMAAHLRLDVVAEGVETEDQSHFLQSRGCSVMQGYYYGRPMPADELYAWMERLTMTDTTAKE
ncbi:putative bifunctional diguanylate cyclase/phosphodiesterase [Paenibacillus tarimensis]|uniref:putative bifunctional diguanylate cyclase/phosphodiesterase n=1 Tax=Paenibacillus tarimensis TaxID=416012 RepID=UPI001F1E8E81|nr:EAL domain-containing protein [Paenibacillus tarimensis]MCF2945839.1 EAL domain-containing protein [Paenibacillus tarimensis]